MARTVRVQLVEWMENRWNCFKIFHYFVLFSLCFFFGVKLLSREIVKENGVYTPQNLLEVSEVFKQLLCFWFYYSLRLSE